MLHFLWICHYTTLYDTRDPYVCAKTRPYKGWLKKALALTSEPADNLQDNSTGEI